MRFAGIGNMLFQEWLWDTIFEGFFAQVGAQKSSKKGSKTPKNNVQDNRMTNSIFKRKLPHQGSQEPEKVVRF